jgi:hypothetical protein
MTKKDKIKINSKETLDSFEKELESELRKQIVDVDGISNNGNIETAVVDDVLDEESEITVKGIDATKQKVENTDKDKQSDDEYEFEEEDTETPGKGYFFKVKEEHLPEMSRLTEKQIPAMALEHTYNELLNGSTKSVYEIYAPALMRFLIGGGGKAREEYSITSVAKQREKAESNYIGREL